MQMYTILPCIINHELDKLQQAYTWFLVNTILPIKCNEYMWVFFLIEATVKSSSLQAFAHGSALALAKCGFENRMKNTFFIRSVSAYRELLLHAPQQQCFAVTIVQHRTSVLNKKACICAQKLAASTTRKACTQLFQTGSVCPHGAGAFIEPKRG